MIKTDRARHWENIYQNANDKKVGWYQPVPVHSLELIEELPLAKSAPIIDIGAGNSSLTKSLAEKGHTDLTALDISSQAIEIARKRAGDFADQIKWKTGDVLREILGQQFDLWHDRAVFHFLWDETEIETYVKKACDSMTPNGYLVLGTFADNGPDMCSGLPVNKYSEEKMEKTFQPCFSLMKTNRVKHHMPSGEPQNYLFGVFLRK